MLRGAAIVSIVRGIVYIERSERFSKLGEECMLQKRFEVFGQLRPP